MRYELLCQQKGSYAMRFLAVICTFILVCSLVTAKGREPLPPPDAGVDQGFAPLHRDTPQTKPDYREIFESVQQGLVLGNIGEFSQHLGSRVLVNLRKGENGYYSASQAYYVLENYLKTRKLVTFSFTTIGESDSNPYATGSAGLNVKGTRESIQVYVSLSWAGDRWVISQINIY
jgi:hypothetical protein